MSLVVVIVAGPTPVGVTAQETRRADGYAVTLRLPPDGLVANEEMQIEFRLEDARNDQERTPVRFARVRVVVNMPSMPAMPGFDEIAHSEGVPGDYGAHPTFAHGGEYRLTLSLLPPDQQPPTMTPPSRAPFSMEFALQVGDARDPRATAGRPSIKRFGMRVSPSHPPRAGVPVDLRVTVQNNFVPRYLPDGSFKIGAGPVQDFDLVHERPLHLFLVREDLGVFAHEHPDPSGPGEFRLQFTFPTAGTYRLFGDVAPRNAGSQVVSDGITVEGPSPPRFDLAAAMASQPSPVVRRVEGLDVEWQWPAPLPAGRTVVVSARLRTATGGEVRDLQPYLGAMGHLMLVHEDGQTFAHSHPDERQPAVPGATVVPFLARFPKPGLYRGWGQFQRAGRLVTVDFVTRAGA